MSEENPTTTTSRKKYILKLSLAISLLVGISLLFLFTTHNERQNDVGHLRRLSLANDLHTGENVRTVNGTVPEVSCPLGHYRPSGSTKLHRVSGNRQDGCYPCPKGKYGDTTGLKHPSCTAPCPVGTYSDEVGLTSIKDCKKCPEGTFGRNRGLTTSTCSGKCPKGKYSDLPGSIKCKDCPPNYRMWQCPID